MDAHVLEPFRRELNAFSLQSDAARRFLQTCIPKVKFVPSFDHVDCITHVELSLDGLLMCVVSVDKMITIWRRDDGWTEWEKQQKFKGHNGAIWKARFAHPSFGNLIATCSIDSNIFLFLESRRYKACSTSPYLAKVRGDKAGAFQHQTTLKYSTAPITDIQFGPHFHGLLLAACTAHGHVVVFEAHDPLNINYFNIVYDVRVGVRLSSLAWSTGRFNESPFLVVGSNATDTEADKRLTVLEVTNQPPFIQPDIQFPPLSPNEPVQAVQFAPQIIPHITKLAVATQRRIYVFIFVFEKSARTEKGQVLRKPAQLVGEIVDEINNNIVALQWNSGGAVVSALHDDGTIRVYKQTFGSAFARTAIIRPPNLTKGPPYF